MSRGQNTYWIIVATRDDALVAVTAENDRRAALQFKTQEAAARYCSAKSFFALDECWRICKVPA
jgi:hypothetical protein